MIFAEHGGFSKEAHLRKDEGFLSALLAGPDALFLPVWRGNLLFNGDRDSRLAALSAGEARALGLFACSPVFLGSLGGRFFFSLALDSTDPDVAERLSVVGRFYDLRRAIPTLADGEAMLACSARAYAHWREHSRFCGRCGSFLSAGEGGHVLACPSPDCGALFFPRTDPAIIVLVTDGERCLLGRQAMWPKGSRSTIAGFVEPGESLEDAVAREVEEETGVKVEGATYFTSQPWPFPGSLMLGFFARATTTEIKLNDRELEEALWYSRAQMVEALNDGSLRLPYHYSISFALVERWFDEGGGGKKLRELARRR